MNCYHIEDYIIIEVVILCEVTFKNCGNIMLGMIVIIYSFDRTSHVYSSTLMMVAIYSSYNNTSGICTQDSIYCGNLEKNIFPTYTMQKVRCTKQLCMEIYLEGIYSSYVYDDIPLSHQQEGEDYGRIYGCEGIERKIQPLMTLSRVNQTRCIIHYMHDKGV